MGDRTHAVEFVNITKRFGDVVANDSVNLYLDRGVIMCCSEKTDQAKLH